jgi:hypothetical protein
MGKCYSPGVVLVLILAAMSSMLVVLGLGAERTKAASEIEPPPAEIILKVPLGGRVFMKVFTHQEHVADYGIACRECHHIYDDGVNTWEEGMPVQKCGACHKAEDLGVEKEEVAGLLTMKLLSHETCGKCHKAGRGD